MGECRNKQKKSCIAQIDYKHFQGRYGRLQLNNVYTCHRFLQRMGKLEEVKFITCFQKLIK